MRPAKLIETTDVPLDQIEISDRLRPVCDLSVQSLRESIETLGLQNEIHLRKVKRTGALRLMAGGHRIAAFRLLGRETIPAKVWDCTDDWAALTEIDDNLAHAELDALELAVFLAKRKEVYERAYPETKALTGAELVAKRWNTADKLSVVSFAAATAEKRSLSERQIRRLVAVGQALSPQDVEQLRSAPKKVTLSDLQVIAKCPGDAARREICQALHTGTAKSAAEAVRRHKAPGAAIKDPTEDARGRIADAWARASKEARRRFAGDYRAELLELLGISDAAPTGEVVDFQSVRGAS